MERFTIKKCKQVFLSENEIYVEFAPDNQQYEYQIKKCETINNESILEDPYYLEDMRVSIFIDLSNLFGSEFTNKFEL